MRKEEMNAWDIIAEVLSILGVLGFLGLQVYYEAVYHVEIKTIIYHVTALLLVYAGFLVLQCYPEFLNGLGTESVMGKVRVYAVRMVRILKVLIVYGMLVPSICDAAGIHINGAYSLILLLLILITIGGSLYKIWKYNKTQGKK